MNAAGTSQQITASPDIERKLDALGTLLIYLTVVVVPLAVAPFAADQVMSIKLVSLYVLVSLTAIVWVTKGFLVSFKVRWSPVLWPALAFLGLSALSAFFSLSPLTSLFGRYLRYEGLLSIFAYVGLLFLALQFFNSEKKMRRLMQLFVGTATIIAFYGILQYLGWDPIPWGAAGFEQSRSFATLGNPIILGGYLAVALSMAITALVTAENKRDGIIWAIEALVIAASLITTLSRGAWLGGLAGVLIGVVLVAREKQDLRKRSFTMLVVLLAGVIGAVGIALVSGDGSTLGSRLLSASNPLAGSGESRVEIWKSAVSMVEEKPLFGVGPDAFMIAFPRYETSRSAKLFPEVLADNAHNSVLQTASTTGIPALIALACTLLAFLYITIFRKGSRVAIAMTAAIMAFITQSLLSVTVVGTSFIPWLLMGVALAPQAKELSVNSLGVKAASVFAGIASVFFIIQSALFFAADVHMGQGTLALMRGDFQGGVDELETATALNPYSDLYLRRLAGAYRTAASIEKNREYFERSLVYMNQALKIAPNELDNFTALGESYTFGGDVFDPAFFGKASYFLERAIEIRKYSPSAHRILAFVLLKKGMVSEALEHLKVALEVDPKDGKTLAYRGRAYRALGERDKAIRAYEEALAIQPGMREAKAEIERLKSEQ